MNPLESVISAVKSYVAAHDEFCQAYETVDPYGFYIEHIRTENWHRLKWHTPSFARSYANLIYVVHDELELLYIGETKKTLMERIDEHLKNKDCEMIGTWSPNAEIQPKKIGYWLKEREVYGSSDLFISIFPIVQLFGLDKSPDSLDVIREGLERYLLKLPTLMNGYGTAEVLNKRYDRYCAWITRQSQLRAASACIDCVDIGHV